VTNCSFLPKAGKPELFSLTDQSGIRVLQNRSFLRSLGGVFALYGAHQASECVRNVITLGSPVSVDASGSAVPPLLKALFMKNSSVTAQAFRSLDHLTASLLML
jgi:hypothetical protein